MLTKNKDCAFNVSALINDSGPQESTLRSTYLLCNMESLLIIYFAYFRRGERSRTRDADVGQHCLLAVLDAADLGEVDVECQEGHAGQEGHGAHAHSIVAGVLVAVEDAVLLHLIRPVDVALVSDAAKDDNGKELQLERE